MTMSRAIEVARSKSLLAPVVIWCEHLFGDTSAEQHAIWFSMNFGRSCSGPLGQAHRHAQRGPPG